MKRNGFASYYIYRVKVGGKNGTAITEMPVGKPESYARQFARFATDTGAMTAWVERALVGGGHQTSWRLVATVKRKRG